ncbi:type II secretion system F family protein [Pontiella agarivorans]|uniref:Type II secretion system F family protein n=1 Tax=Pontiella agarivorans TaxID=3038953 RepID=A0ABU5MXV0_9BACT|nr:type II secretion system F family protein [Pontiella agarivorans]MDZ8119037.1 type II secretion system F family protein [Pontiella agarivorans]
MPKFRYTAHDINGREKSGVVNAASSTAAETLLKSRGLFPTEVAGTDLKLPKTEKTAESTPSHKRGLSTEIRLPALLTPITPKQLMILTRQLATLIHSGMPLLKGLKILERQESHNTLKKAIGRIAESIEGGSTFADALAEHPRIFNRLYVNMVKAGEAGGVLDTVLDRLASYMEKAQKVKNRVKSAMTYPIVVLLASSAIMIFLMVSIIPKFEIIFSDMLDGRALPPLTLYVMGISENIKNQWPVGLAALAGAAVLFIILKRFKRGRYVLDALKLVLPLFGKLIRMSALARFARTLGTLMESGVPVLQALSIVKETLSNEIISNAVQNIHDNIKDGESMAAPVEANSIFPPIFGGMVEVGEETGELPDMLLKTADMYEDEVDNIVAGLSSIIEPLLIVILAVVVGTIVIAMFLPMVSIIGNLS